MATGEYCRRRHSSVLMQWLTDDTAPGTGPLIGDAGFQDTILTRIVPKVGYQSVVALVDGGN